MCLKKLIVKRDFFDDDVADRGKNFTSRVYPYDDEQRQGCRKKGAANTLHLHKHRTAITSFCFMKFVHENHFEARIIPSRRTESNSVGTAFQFPAASMSSSSSLSLYLLDYAFNLLFDACFSNSAFPSPNNGVSICRRNVFKKIEFNHEGKSSSSIA